MNIVAGTIDKEIAGPGPALKPRTRSRRALGWFTRRDAAFSRRHRGIQHAKALARERHASVMGNMASAAAISAAYGDRPTDFEDQTQVAISAPQDAPQGSWAALKFASDPDVGPTRVNVPWTDLPNGYAIATGMGDEAPIEIVIDRLRMSVTCGERH